jgi:hypothetical protein
MGGSGIARACGAALLVSLVASAFTGSAPARPAAIPQQLVGLWGKTVTAAMWHKRGITYEKVGHWGVEIGADGTTGLLEPPGKSDNTLLTTMKTSVTGHRIVFGPTSDDFCMQKVKVDWKLKGKTLSLTLAGPDHCDARAVLLTVGSFTRS